MNGSWSDGLTTVTRTDSNVTGNISVTASFAQDAPSGGGGSAVPAVPTTPITPPTPITSVTRLSGASRVDTAIASAQANYTGQISNVVLATTDNFPDALAGSVLAYKRNAPILFSRDFPR